MRRDFFRIGIDALHPGIVKVRIQNHIDGVRRLHAAGVASYRASASADTSMFTAIKTASAAVIQGRMRDFSFPMHFATSG